MFFVNTVRAAEKTIIRNSPNIALRRQGALPGPHLLWLCNEVRTLSCTDPSAEEKALTMVTELTKGMVGQRWWHVSVPDRLLAADERRGFSKVHQPRCLAIDFRNVIRNEEEHQFLPGALEVIAQLVLQCFDQNVYIMYRAKPASPNAHRAFLERSGFFKQTGVLPQNIVVYKTRPETATECRRLCVTDYISKRIEVLNYAGDARVLYAFDPVPGEGVAAADGREITRVKNWKQIKDLMPL